eukprot:TRINITY_DN26965_c0_g1_i3.p1 TRINITY_DN26965_c0_g1~~TRINITY_DN26965_c0_g1_i3.p1  ORF type:complete len:396 (+),score=34.65 TRINITY_DN26965_c0_g1_i3:83-1189(+)
MVHLAALPSIDVAIALGISCAVSIVIWKVLSNRGPLMILAGFGYISSLTAVQLLVKLVSSPPYNFKYPCLLTSIMFLAVSIAVETVHQAQNLKPQSSRSLSTMLRAGPFALCNSLSVISNNASIVLIGAGVNAALGAATPLATAMLSFSCGAKISSASWMGLFLASIGVTIIVLSAPGESKFDLSNSSVKGIVLALVATLIRSGKVVSADLLLSPSSYDRPTAPDESNALIQPASLTPMEVWRMQAPLLLIISFTCTWRFENVSEAWAAVTPAIVSLTCLCCFTACVMNLLSLVVLKEVGATSMQLIGKLNVFITMVLAVVIMHEHISVWVAGGAVVLVCGIVLFESGKEAKEPKMSLKSSWLQRGQR